MFLCIQMFFNKAFQDTKGAIKSWKYKDRQSNNLKENPQNDKQMLHRKLMIVQHESHWKSGVNSGAEEG